MAQVRVTKADLEEYFSLNEERKALNRQGQDLAKRIAKLEEKFTQHVADHGGQERSCIRCGYRLALVVKNGTVSWITEFLRMCKLAKRDPEEEAEKVRAAAPKKDELVVEPPEEKEAA